MQNLETFTTLDAEIKGLALTISQVDHRLSAARIQYDRVKNFFPF